MWQDALRPTQLQPKTFFLVVYQEDKRAKGGQVLPSKPDRKKTEREGERLSVRFLASLGI